MSNPPSFEELVCLHFGWTITVSASPNFAGPQLKTTWKYNKDQQGDSTDARFFRSGSTQVHIVRIEKLPIGSLIATGLSDEGT